MTVPVNHNAHQPDYHRDLVRTLLRIIVLCLLLLGLSLLIVAQVVGVPALESVIVFLFGKAVTK